MISLNRHCRVFEEIILQDCLKVNSIEPARKWLDEMSIIDSASALSIAETFFNQYTKTYLEKLGFHTFEDVYNEVKNAVNETNRIFFLKLINAVETGDYKWIAPVISIEQEKSNTFFERYFNIRF